MIYGVIVDFKNIFYILKKIILTLTHENNLKYIKKTNLKYKIKKISFFLKNNFENQRQAGP